MVDTFGLEVPTAWRAKAFGLAQVESIVAAGPMLRLVDPGGNTPGSLSRQGQDTMPGRLSDKPNQHPSKGTCQQGTGTALPELVDSCCTLGCVMTGQFEQASLQLGALLQRT